jgi:hypothetical protein
MDFSYKIFTIMYSKVGKTLLYGYAAAIAAYGGFRIITDSPTIMGEEIVDVRATDEGDYAVIRNSSISPLKAGKEGVALAGKLSGAILSTATFAYLARRVWA